MLATTSTRWGTPKFLVNMAFLRMGWEDIQSRVSALFSQLTKNLVVASPSNLPNTLEAVRCKKRSNKRRSKHGWSISFSRYPLPRYSQNASTRIVDPPLINTTDTSYQSACTIRPNAAISWWGSLLQRSSVATKTLREMSMSQVRTNTRTSSPCSSNSTLQLPSDFAQLMQRDKIRGNIPLRMMDQNRQQTVCTRTT